MREYVREQLVERDIEAASHMRRQVILLSEIRERRIYFPHPVGVGGNGHQESRSHFSLSQVAQIPPAILYLSTPECGIAAAAMRVHVNGSERPSCAPRV